MKFDFETKPDRHGKDALAVDMPYTHEGSGLCPDKPREGFDLIPMWVADMNFFTAPSITEAVVERAKHPCFGYFEPREAYYESIIRWQKEIHHVKTDALTPEVIGYENGVLGGLSTALQAFTTPGEAVLLHSPVYIGFSGTLSSTGRTPVLSSLYRDKEGVWRMDYEDMEKKIRENHIHFAVFCSPHNPCGRVWTKEEIEEAMDVYRRNDVIVFSDEIWSDLLLNGHEHIPTQSVNEDAMQRTIALYAPSKTFNLAGMIGSYHIIYNPYLRDRMRRQSSMTHYNSMNVLSQHALIGAYSETGKEWLMGLREVLSENINYACDFIKENFEGISLQKPEGTYMLFLDCSEYLKKKGITLDDLLKAGWDVGVAWQDGRPFHGESSIRMNLALPAKYVREAFTRLEKYVFCG